MSADTRRRMVQTDLSGRRSAGSRPENDPGFLPDPVPASQESVSDPAITVEHNGCLGARVHFASHWQAVGRGDGHLLRKVLSLGKFLVPEFTADTLILRSGEHVTV
jgi:hypothetical protein